MNEPVFSSYWHRVAHLTPILCETVSLSRHVYRGQPWYVLTNRLTGVSHRFNAAAYTFIGQLDGNRSVQAIWDAARAMDQALPTQDACIRLLARLHDAGLIQSDMPASAFRDAAGDDPLTGRERRSGRSLSNPLCLRLPLWNPNRFLTRMQRLSAPLFTPAAGFLWSLFVGWTFLLAAMHWPELTANWSDRLTSPDSLLVMWLVFPVMKLLHEFGHACAVRHWGGNVYEMGVTVLAFTPVPYVDASAAAAFSDRTRRIMVSAIGMMVDLALAGIGLLVWLNTGPGLLNTIAFATLFLGGVSSILFNGNPLLRYDGYYILADLLEIPNLWQRSNKYLRYILRRFVLADDTADSPVLAAGERPWFVLYGPLSLLYKTVLLLWLVWMISFRFFIIGMLIAIWGGVTLFLLPAIRNVAALIRNPGPNRMRTFWLVGAGMTLAALLLCAPLPLWTSAQGVVWIPEQSVVRAGVACEIVDVAALSGQTVEPGELLFTGRDPELSAQQERLQTRLAELRATYHAYPIYERVKRKIVLDSILSVSNELQQAESRIRDLEIRSRLRGRFEPVDARNLPGHFARQGEVLGHVLTDEPATVRVAVGQDGIGLIREDLRRVRLQLSERPGEIITAAIERIVPGADFILPSAALGSAGGGFIPVDPTDATGLRTMEAVFQIDLTLPAQAPRPHIGGRAYVRFEHSAMPLVVQWYRGLRQALLREVNE